VGQTNNLKKKIPTISQNCTKEETQYGGKGKEGV